MTVYDKDGKALASQSVELKDMVYGNVYEFKFEKALATTGGAYYIVSVKDEKGESLATDLKIG